MSEPLDGLYQILKNAPKHPDRPFITLTYAQSLDGSIAAADRKPITLSNDLTLKMTHTLRSLHDAILIGVGTVLADDPQLNVRLVEGRDPQPIVLDSQLRSPPSARLFRNLPYPWMATSTDIESAKKDAFESMSCKILPIRPVSTDLLDLTDLLRQLPPLGIDKLMVEGGAQVITSFFQAMVVDLLVLTISPTIVGGLQAIQSTLNETGSPLRIKESNWVELERDAVYWGIPKTGE